MKVQQQHSIVDEKLAGRRGALVIGSYYSS